MRTTQGSQRPDGGVPHDRYGRTNQDRRRLRGWRLWAFVVLMVLILGLVAFIVYYNLGPKPIEANRTSFRQLPGNALELNMEVHRDDPAQASVCVVRVRSINGGETGRREVFVPAGADSVSTVIHSTKSPVTASVVGCSYNIPPYMSRSQRPME